jgi:hypothetical protein
MNDETSNTQQGTDNSPPETAAPLEPETGVSAQTECVGPEPGPGTTSPEPAVPPRASPSAFHVLARLWRASAFSPTGFLVRAALFAAIHFLLDLIGLRAYTTVLSGSLASGRMPQDLAGALGIIYVFTYFLAVIVSPILVLAAALFAAVQVVMHRGRRGEREDETQTRRKDVPGPVRSE